MFPVEPIPQEQRGCDHEKTYELVVGYTRSPGKMAVAQKVIGLMIEVPELLETESDSTVETCEETEGEAGEVRSPVCEENSDQHEQATEGAVELGRVEMGVTEDVPRQ